jgi:hypothetical protein
VLPAESPRNGELFAVLQDGAMVKRITPVWVIAFFLLTACGALCQSERPSVSLIHGDGSNSPEIQRQEMRTRQSLPDAPPVHPEKQAEKVHTFMDEAGSPLTVGAFRIKADIIGRNRTETRLSPTAAQLHRTVQSSSLTRHNPAPFLASFFVRWRSNKTWISPYEQWQLCGPDDLCSFAHYRHT